MKSKLPINFLPNQDSILWNVFPISEVTAKDRIKSRESSLRTSLTSETAEFDAYELAKSIFISKLRLNKKREVKLIQSFLFLVGLPNFQDLGKLLIG